jgi:LmbE family N-acetylglucosaminyl deacetylase
MFPIYLSPHLDDVCFSIGAYVLRSTAGTLVNVFSQSNYVVPEYQFSQSMPTSVEAITELRKQEDELFAQACGLSRLNLDFEDIAIEGDSPFSSGNNAERVDILQPVLLDALQDIAHKHNNSQIQVFCPMAIGGHRDHQTLLQAVIQLYPQLSHLMKFIFYEDFPYAANPEARVIGIENFSRLWVGDPLMQYRFYLDTQLIQQKNSLIMAYESQIAPWMNSSSPMENFMHQENGLDIFYESLWAPNGVLQS